MLAGTTASNTNGLAATSVATGKGLRPSRRSRRGRDALWNSAAVAGIAISVIGLWQGASALQLINGHLLGSPAGIVVAAIRGVTSGTLISNAGVTLYETLVGLAIGSIAGTASGLFLWFAPKVSRPAEGFSILLNSIPKIALGPLIVIWFGSGLSSKIWLAAVSTYAIAMIAATSAVRELDHDLLNLFQTLGAQRMMTFRKLILPGALPWIFSALRMNIGFALIGAVIGEYIASQNGLGHEIFVAGSLFDLNTVWLGIIVLTLMATMLTLIVRLFEERLISWKSEQ